MILWRDDQDGIEAFASLWRSAATLLSTNTSTSQNDDDTTSSRRRHGGVVVLAYPNCRKSVLQRWLDIFMWMQDEFHPCTTIQGTLLDNDNDGAIAVRLTRIGRTLPPLVEDATVDQENMEQRTKSWVQRVLVEMGICPFTKSTTKSGQGLGEVGVPIAKIAYHASAASPEQICHLMADTWESIHAMMVAGPSAKTGVSSILLSAKRFDDDFDLWSGPIFAMLEAGVVATGAEKQIGVVCFHPKYATPDGTSWPGFGHMHSVPRLQKWVTQHDPSQQFTKDDIAAGGAWQRRTPHATINVLRADQLELAEGQRTSGKLYSDNICKLVGTPNGVGTLVLGEELRREQEMGAS